MCLSYPEICLHAVSRDTSSFPHPCLYLLTSPVSLDADEGEDQETVEMRLVLDNEEKCNYLLSSPPSRFLFDRTMDEAILNSMLL